MLQEIKNVEKAPQSTLLTGGMKNTETETEISSLTYEDEINISAEIESLVTDFKSKIESLLSNKNIQFAIKKKIKTNTKIPYTVKNSVYIFYLEEENLFIEISFSHELSQIFLLLQPTLDHLKEITRKIKFYRMFGVPAEEKTYKPNTSVKNWSPYDHQWTMWAIKNLLPKMANLSQMGTGKTLATIMTIDSHLQEGKTRKGKILYIAPAATLNGLKYTHFGQYAPHLSTSIIDGPFMVRVQKIMDSTVDVKLINFEAFTMSTEIQKTDSAGNGLMKDEVKVIKKRNEYGMEYTEEVKTGKKIPDTNTLKFSDVVSCIDWDLVIIDECHKIKNPDAQRTGNIIDCFKEVPHKIIMSGTVAANKLHDVYCPFIFLNGAKTFSSVLTHRGDASKLLTYGELYGSFLRSYFDRSGFGYTPKRKTIETLKTMIETCSIRFEKSECMNLPDKVYELRLVDLSDKQLKLYNDLKTKLTAELTSGISDKFGDDEKKISVTAMIALNMKLAEAANGWIYDNNGYPIQFAENPKLDAMLECIDDADDGETKFIIWSQFKQDMKMLRDAIAKEYGQDSVAIIDGGVNFKERYRLQEKFNKKEDKLRFVVCNVLAAGTGIDLIGASYEIYFSNSFHKVERSQSEDRAHRPGMQNKLTIIDIVARQTIDEKVIDALKSNKAMNAALTENLGFDPSLLNIKDGDATNNINDEPAVINENGNGNGNGKNKDDIFKNNSVLKDCCILSVISVV
jgi:SNF2 family DNA or RNA helicase